MDAGLRDLERDAQSSGDPHIEARLLGEKIRSGELNPHLVMAAAALDHPAARLVYPDQALGAHPFSVSLVEAGRLHVVRVLFAIATECRPVGRRRYEFVRSVHTWLEHPCREHKRHVRACLEGLEQNSGDVWRALGESVVRLRSKRSRARVVCTFYELVTLPTFILKRQAFAALLDPSIPSITLLCPEA